MIEVLCIAVAAIIVAAIGVPVVIRYTKAKREMSETEDDDIKIYDPKKDHINADRADRCNHGR